MKEREQRTHAGEHRHKFVKLMFKDQERRELAQLAVAQKDRNIFQAEHQQVARDAERNFREHRVRIRMPESEPCPQGLSDIDHQNGDRAAIADKADDDGGVQDRLQLSALQNVDQKPGEERACAQGDDSQIEKDPEAEGEAIVHVGLVQPVVEAQTSGIDSQPQAAPPTERATAGIAGVKFALHRERSSRSAVGCR